MSRILVYEPRHNPGEGSVLLDEPAHDVIVCRGREPLFDAVAEGRPDALVYVLGDLEADLSSLWALRRAAPKLPIILLSGPAGLETRRSIQELKPTYYGVFPLEPMELSDVLRGALSQHARAS